MLALRPAALSGERSLAHTPTGKEAGRLPITGLPLSESMRIAWRALAVNKLRAGLTMLGIIIGIFAVIAMLSLGQSAASSITSQISSLGTNMLVVSGQPPRNRQDIGAPPSLTLDDSRILGERYRSDIAAVAPLSMGSAKVKMGDKEADTQITGTTPEYMDVDNAPVRAGRFLNMEDVKGRTKVAIVGQTVVERLLGDKNLNPIGRIMDINRIPFRIVGVLESKGSVVTADQDDKVIVPITTAMRRLYNQTSIAAITVECVSPGAMADAQDQMSGLLRRRHHLHPPFPDSDDFTIQSLTSFVDVLGKVTGTLTALLGGVATISLLVGGIGIMNIMLVSVTERTREIGLRKALGATRQDILVQFLVEAMMLSLVGGIIGMALGIGVVAVVVWLAHWPFVINPWVVAVAAVVSAGIGIGFGSYPAAKAARLSPIDALRYE